MFCCCVQLTRRDGRKEVKMADCNYIASDMLNHPIKVRVDYGPLDFISARSLADRKAVKAGRFG